jgi:hypothetical protein
MQPLGGSIVKNMDMFFYPASEEWFNYLIIT